MKTVFIHGGSGTTGLRLKSRLEERQDIQICHLPEESRKDPVAAAQIMNESDIVFLCLPDAAALEAAASVTNPDTVILDTSTAHRTSPEWTYGFPELSSVQEAAIRNSHRIAVPGCHASGFIALVAPLINAGVLSSSALLSCHSLTGYSGGGKKMIAEYESEERSALLNAPRQYGLSQQHKHIPEMCLMTHLDHAPVFCPIVADFYSGMEVTVPLFKQQLSGDAGIDDIRNVLKRTYAGPIVRYRSEIGEEGFLSANTYSGMDCMEVGVCGNDDRMLLIARYDNLGKGASGAAIQCMNLVLNIEPTRGLVI